MTPGAALPCAYLTTTKAERLQIRVDPCEKRLLERAAEAAHQSVSAFVLQAAALHAEQALVERSVIRLSAEATQAFTEDPPGRCQRAPG